MDVAGAARVGGVAGAMTDGRSGGSMQNGGAFPPPPQAAAQDEVSYAGVLAAHALRVVLRGPWASVGETARVQGWKLHVSSIPTQAPALLAAALPVLLNAGVCFKTARDEGVLSQLNEGELGATQVGKFITIYPEDDDRARALATQLVEATRGFDGPVIVTDVRLGDVVYARYGGFNPVVSRDRLGQPFLCIYAPDGRLHEDAYRVPFVAPEGVANPFDWWPAAAEGCAQGTQGAAPLMGPSSRLLGPGYLVLDVVKQHAKGSIFRGLDLRSQQDVAIKIIKQGRQHCMSDRLGRDMRSRLRRQHALHQALRGHVPIPRADPYFEVNGDGYLPLEYVEGESIEVLAARCLAGQPWSVASGAARARLLAALDQLVQVVDRLHELGYVHRDLTASNVWMGADGNVWLLDLELAHAVDDPAPPFGLGTPGFMSPNQRARGRPAYADDIYALGCIVILALTSIDPRRVLFAGESGLVARLRELTRGAPDLLLRTAARCASYQAEARPAIAALRHALARAIEADVRRAPLAQRRPSGQARLAARNTLSRVVELGQRGLLLRTAIEPETRLWLSPAIGSDGGQGATRGAYELRRSASRGVAGVVYTLGRLARFGIRTRDGQQRVAAAVDWLLRDAPAPDTGLPGLHFGDAGVAVALAEAVGGGLCTAGGQTREYILRALGGPLDWPDVTHGAAGQGIAALYCGDRLGDETLTARAHRCAEYLVDTQLADGSWRMPAGVEGMSGQTLTGFAHGVAGIVYFLAAYAHRLAEPAAHRAWSVGAAWLMSQSIETDGVALEWSYSDEMPERWHWWCHGSPGIALTFLRLFEQTGEETYQRTAARALRALSGETRSANLSQCHGLAGLGEISLEAARVLGDRQWLERAESMARTLVRLGRGSPRAMTWLAEDPHVATADLMVGSAGVVHFLLRTWLGPGTMGPPLLLDPD